VWCR